MCKKLKQILFPFNIFGKDRKSISIDLPNEFVDLPLPGFYSETFNIVWSGERLIWCCTKLSKQGVGGGYSKLSGTYTDGDNSTESITLSVRRTYQMWSQIPELKLHFLCTNVTSLVVNGETLI